MYGLFSFMLQTVKLKRGLSSSVLAGSTLKMHMAKEMTEERHLNVNANIFEFFITPLFVHYGSWLVGTELEDSAQVLFIPGYLGYKDFMLQYGLTSRSSIMSWRLELSWHFSSDSDIPKNLIFGECV